MIAWCLKVYHWFWHDVLHLKEPISWVLVHSIRDHQLIWTVAGGAVLGTCWALLMHFIAML